MSIDATGKANGRGAYVCRSGTCVETALSKGGIARALGSPVPPTIADELRRIVSRGTFDGAQ